MLKPNVIVSRRYQDTRTSRQVSVLLVQCSDARDILGHYPPVCYVAQGWTLGSSQAADWQVDDLRIAGTAYMFTATRRALPAAQHVYNFILLSDGRVCRGMNEVDDVARDARKKFFGASQVQVIFDDTISQRERDEIFTSVVRAYRPLLDTIRSGARFRFPHASR